MAATRSFLPFIVMGCGIYEVIQDGWQTLLINLGRIDVVDPVSCPSLPILEISGFTVLGSMTPIETIENYNSLLKVGELSSLTQISTKTLYRLINQRKLPALRIGGSVRLEPKSTAEWLRKRLS